MTPARRLSLIMGRTLSDVVTIGAQALLLTVVALPFGLDASFSGVVLALLLIMALSFGLSSASYAMGLILKDEDSFAPFVQGVTLPLMLLSGVLLPLSLAPLWLRNISKANPLAYSVDALRSLFRGDLGNSDVAVGLIVTVALSGLLTWWATRQFQKSSS